MSTRFYKQVEAPTLGIDVFSKSHLIDPRSWVTMRQFRTKQGIIQAFPGWESILSAGNAGGFGTLLEDYEKFDKTTFLLAGGPTKIYRYDSVGKTLVDITGAAVLAPTRDDPWWTFQYADIFYLINKINGMYSWNGAGNIVNVAGAPKGRSAEVLNDHVLVLNYDDGTDHPTGIKWCAEGDPTSWVPTNINDAGAFDLQDSPDEGMALVALGTDLIAYKKRTIIPITWIGGNDVFARRQAIAGVGLIGQYAIVDIGDEHIFMGSDTFYSYKGGADVNYEFSKKIRDKVYSRLHPIYANRSRALFIEETREVLFIYPTVNSTGDCDECVIYNFEDETWYGPFPIICTMTGFVSRAKTIVIDDVLDIIDSVGIIIDQYPGSVGGPQNLFMNVVGDILEIRESYFDDNGTDIIRELESGDHRLNQCTDKGGRSLVLPEYMVFLVTMLNITIPDAIKSGSVKVYLGHKMLLHDDIVWDGPYTLLLNGSYDYKVSVMASGRFFRLKVVAEGSQAFSLASFEYEFSAMGRY